MGYSTKMDEEMEYRRQLLAAARSGKAAAQKELQEEYGVRIYTPTERASLSVDTSAFLHLPRLLDIPLSGYDSEAYPS